MTSTACNLSGFLARRVSAHLGDEFRKLENNPRHFHGTPPGRILGQSGRPSEYPAFHQITTPDGNKQPLFTHVTGSLNQPAPPPRHVYSTTGIPSNPAHLYAHSQARLHTHSANGIPENPTRFFAFISRPQNATLDLYTMTGFSKNHADYFWGGQKERGQERIEKSSKQPEANTSITSFNAVLLLSHPFPRQPSASPARWASPNLSLIHI